MEPSKSSTQVVSGRSAVGALLLLVPAPSLGALAAMILWPGHPAAQAFFFVAKLWLLALPVLWHRLVDRQPLQWPGLRWAGMPAAVISGLIIFAGIVGAYALVGRHLIDPEPMRDKAREIGLATVGLYLLGTVYWCTINSILEEYVWRWFVFTRCEALMPRRLAVIASALFFTLHHIVALSVYFDPLVTALASLGVFIGGATWSWLYLRYRNIWAAYVSHVFADLAIFGIGYLLIFT